MSVENGMMEMTFETDKDAFFSDEYEGNGAREKVWWEEFRWNRPEELNVAPYSGVIKCETDVVRIFCQAHNVLGSEDI